jgi:hypothetical protein
MIVEENTLLPVTTIMKAIELSFMSTRVDLFMRSLQEDRNIVENQVDK